MFFKVGYSLAGIPGKHLFSYIHELVSKGHTKSFSTALYRRPDREKVCRRLSTFSRLQVARAGCQEGLDTLSTTVVRELGRGK